MNGLLPVSKVTFEAGLSFYHPQNDPSLIIIMCSTASASTLYGFCGVKQFDLNLVN